MASSGSSRRRVRKMRAMLRRIVWPSVVAAVAGVSAVVLAVLGMNAVSLAVGLGAVTAAILATRDTR